MPGKQSLADQELGDLHGGNGGNTVATAPASQAEPAKSSENEGGLIIYLPGAEIETPPQSKSGGVEEVQDGHPVIKLPGAGVSETQLAQKLSPGNELVELENTELVLILPSASADSKNAPPAKAAPRPAAAEASPASAKPKKKKGGRKGGGQTREERPAELSPAPDLSSEASANDDSPAAPPVQQNGDRYGPWDNHRLTREDWVRLEVFDGPLNTDDDIIKAGLLSERHLGEYNAIMSHVNQSLWQKIWNTWDGKSHSTIDLAINDRDVKYRTSSDQVVCMRVPQLWLQYPMSPKAELDSLVLITNEQMRKDVSALILKLTDDNEREKLGHDRHSIIRHANYQYQTLISYLLYREKKLADIELDRQRRLDLDRQRVTDRDKRKKAVIDRASPLFAMAAPLKMWVDNNPKNGK